jgi:hypothetical protein
MPRGRGKAGSPVSLHQRFTQNHAAVRNGAMRSCVFQTRDPPGDVMTSLEPHSLSRACVHAPQATRASAGRGSRGGHAAAASATPSLVDSLRHTTIGDFFYKAAVLSDDGIERYVLMHVRVWWSLCARALESRIVDCVCFGGWLQPCARLTFGTRPVLSLSLPPPSAAVPFLPQPLLLLLHRRVRPYVVDQEQRVVLACAWI